MVGEVTPIVELGAFREQRKVAKEQEGKKVQGVHRDGLRSTLALLETMAYDQKYERHPVLIANLGSIHQMIQSVLDFSVKE